MKRVLVLAALMLAALPLHASAAAPTIQSALPHSATLVLTTKIVGYKSADAVYFRDPTPRLGVVFLGTSSAKLAWSTKVDLTPTRLVSPGPTGVFLAAGPVVNNSGILVVAYRVHSGKVLSALPTPTSKPAGATSVSISATKFTLHQADKNHTGSVKYRYDTPYLWHSGEYQPRNTVHVPAYSPSKYPTPNGVVTMASGDKALMKLQIAWTDAQKEQGLMNTAALDPDSGMVFVWNAPTADSFWMFDTPIDLSIAFIDSSGTIIDIEEMKANTQTSHQPVQCLDGSIACYQYAVEMSAGYFTGMGIKIGDKVAFSVPCGSVDSFQSPVLTCYS